MFNDCLIMAGGSGTRLWPASSSRLPKQFLPAEEKSSFFSMALERALALGGNDGRVIVITGKPHIPHVIADAAKLTKPEKKRLLVIGEPAAKNTAPAIACAVVLSLFGGPERNMFVLTSDHIIKPMKTFKADAAMAAKAAAEGSLAVFGIPPSRAETGYGYIETGSGGGGVYKAAAFHEKPDLKTAEKYAADGRFFWNSGMFAFNTGFMAGLFRLFASEVFQPFEKLKEPARADFTVSRGIKILSGWRGLEKAYSKAKSISFDYAIAEKCTNTAMIRANFDWIDVGNWEEYAKICAKNNSEVFNVSGETCYVDSDIPVALAGVDDLIVVIRSGKNGKGASALITRKGQTQKVREIVEQIKKAGRNDLL
jgi:mannose-1-phosphate guanylyltransferase/mannose-1-phosphate guanylyltransferase/mannose-6-phosphate isomerase